MALHKFGNLETEILIVGKADACRRIADSSNGIQMNLFDVLAYTETHQLKELSNP